MAARTSAPPTPPSGESMKENSWSFLSTFLSRPASSIPKGAQWIVSFEPGERTLQQAIFPAINEAYKKEPGLAVKWDTETAAAAILADEYQKNRGCMFCQAIGLPGEGLNVNSEGNIKTNAFLRSYVGGGRNDLPIMKMTFLDTNISFVDSFLRGWALATANFGLIARHPYDTKNYRTDIICYKFGITPKGPFITQSIFFRNACCVSVSEEEYQYSHASAPVLREARFIYNSYSVNTVDGNSPDILANPKDTFQTKLPEPMVRPATLPDVRRATAVLANERSKPKP